MLQIIDGKIVRLDDEVRIKPRSTLADLLRQVAQERGVMVEAVKSERRDRPYPEIRGEFAQRAHAVGYYSISQIGRAINRTSWTVRFMLGKTPQTPSYIPKSISLSTVPTIPPVDPVDYNAP